MDLDSHITADYLMNSISGIIVSAKAGMDEQACRLVLNKTLSVFRILKSETEFM